MVSRHTNKRSQVNETDEDLEDAPAFAGKRLIAEVRHGSVITIKAVLPVGGATKHQPADI